MPASAQNILRYPVQAAYHAPFLYPIIGLGYFVTHPFLWPLVRARLLPCFLLSVFVLANLFIWTYLPQVAFLSIFHFAGAWINGTFLVLGEGAAVVAILFEAFLVDEAQVDIFDAVLVHKGFADLVSTRRPVQVQGSDPVKRLGKPFRSSVYGPFSFRQILEFIIFLPFNLIPVIGVPIFLFLTGYRGGPLQHWRYFKLLDFDRKERNTYVRRRQWQYTGFGTVALVLQLVPVFSMLFLLTTAAGSALWAVRLEEQRRLEQTRVNQPPEYVDNPV